MTQHPARSSSEFSADERAGVGAAIAWLTAEAAKFDDEAAGVLLLFERNALKSKASAWSEAASRLKSLL